MPYDPGLAERLANLFSTYPGLDQKKMFGGLGYMLHGNMCFGIHQDTLMIRIGVKAAEKILKEPHVRPMDLTGKVMKGWATVEPEAMEEDEALQGFCELAIDFVKTLPKK